MRNVNSQNLLRTTIVSITVMVVFLSSNTALSNDFQINQSGLNGVISTDIAEGIDRLDVQLNQTGPGHFLELSVSENSTVKLIQEGQSNRIVLDSTGTIESFIFFQSGENNLLSATNRSSGLVANINQSGSSNQLSFVAYGSGNSATIDQSGISNSLTLEQHGSGNVAELVQSGVGNQLIVEQHNGSLNISVHQDGFGDVLTIR